MAFVIVARNAAVPMALVLFPGNPVLKAKKIMKVHSLKPLLVIQLLMIKFPINLKNVE